ncbi:hypothetical protein GCM10023213_28240 [Prosthecobacter algae]|uniref:GH25 family protein n=1 Tax=Prosthecobacter algae TaxID=1144682 RepID=A0ABP9PA18_9BACT
MKKILQIAAVAAAIFSGPVSAHYLWIEAAADGLSAKIFFGEYQEDVREIKGGRLDEMIRRETFVTGTRGGKESVEAQTNQDHFLVSATSPVSGFLTQKLDYEVKDWRKSGIGIVKPMFYARAWVPGSALPKPELKLDITPADKEGKSVLVSFNGQPLAKAKVNVHAPNLWSRELETNQDGTLAIPTPWSGSYVIEVIYLEKAAGSYQSIEYEALRHRSTFTVVAK